MRLIVGLGNPGEKYLNTRHNLGFMILEKVAQKREAVFRLEPHFQARFADMGSLEDRIKLIQPQTFMNESGKAVAKIKNYWKVDSEDIWVIYDEADLDLGKVRVSLGGSSAGHKGVESIIQAIGEQFWRIRVGIGKSPKIPTEEWVLKKLTKNEITEREKIIDQTADLVLESLSKGIKEQTISNTNLREQLKGANHG